MGTDWKVPNGSAQKRLEEPACVALFARRDGLGLQGWFRRAFPLGSDVDEVVAHLQHVEVMLNHHHGVTLVRSFQDIDERCTSLKCRPVVGSFKMCKCSGADAGQLGRHLTRCASAAQRGALLPQRDGPNPPTAGGGDAVNLGDGFEKLCASSTVMANTSAVLLPR